MTRALRSSVFRADLRRVLALGLPLIGSHVAQYALTLTDAVMLGRYDVTALAGETVGGALFFVLFIMGSGIAWAVMPMVARADGAGDPTQMRRATRMGMWLSALFTLFCVPIFVFATPLMNAIGQEPDVAALAGAYLGVLGAGLLPALWVMVLKSALAALERTRVVFWVTLAALPVNVLLNWLFIFGPGPLPEMGIRGAALGSLLVHLASFAVLVVYVRATLPERAVFARFWRFDGEAFAAVLRLGWPIGLTNLAEVGLFSASSVMMGWVGTIPLAAHGIALQITSTAFMVHVGLSNVATIRAGNALGRGDAAGLRRGAVVVIGVSGAAALATITVFLTLPETLISLFLDPDEPARAEVLAIGRVLLAAAALFQLVDAAQVLALGLLRGVQDTRVPMVIAAIAYWGVGAPLAWALAFPLGVGGVGIWLGLAGGLGVAGVFMMLRFWRGRAATG
ncbi:multidrug resistance protein, MATE family [Tranquillimonas rosea]|uniref:Multidrug-efflux transporter n=1 Tax=Tranquillimonas rosea TaxID=641238 RepID=A0A1H9VXA6_9RHOB|nr:MATE family efflux transporter [Tranquillimonas rosea]SES26151.1 multidrug resistance protein, MATE family [Tranquillimonas rosea]